MKLWKYGNDAGIRTLAVCIIACFHISTLAYSATQSPAFFAPNDFGVAAKIKSLAVVAGCDWGETAERSRATGLHRLGGEDLKLALQEKARKYAGTDALDMSKVPLSEFGEIAEAAFRGGLETDAYGWALFRWFLSSKAKISDSAVAAKLLAGFERGLAGVIPNGANGERVTFAPCWILTPFQTGTYCTTLPGGGHFESSWSNSLGSCSYELRTSAKRVDCRIRLSFGVSVYNVTINGEDVDFNGSAFTAIPDGDGVAKMDIRYIWAGGPKKRKK